MRLFADECSEEMGNRLLEEENNSRTSDLDYRLPHALLIVNFAHGDSLACEDKI